MTTIERSHGKPRPRTPRADRTPMSAAAALAAPHRDPSSGRFCPGNPGGRLRQVAALGREQAESLLRLAIDDVAPWLRPHLQAAQQHAQQLVDALAVTSPELVALCGDEAKARLLAAACLTEGSRVDCPRETSAEWREEARAWLREARQIALTRRGLARDTPKPAHNPLLAAIEAAGAEAAE